MSAEIKSLVLDTWAGRRYVNCGETVLVPKHAVVDLPKDTHKVEQGYYDGHLNGYGGVVDAR